MLNDQLTAENRLTVQNRFNQRKRFLLFVQKEKEKVTIQRHTHNAHIQCNQCDNMVHLTMRTMKKVNRYKGQVTTFDSVSDLKQV